MIDTAAMSYGNYGYGYPAQNSYGLPNYYGVPNYYGPESVDTAPQRQFSFPNLSLMPQSRSIPVAPSPGNANMEPGIGDIRAFLQWLTARNQWMPQNAGMQPTFGQGDNRGMSI